MSNERVTAEQRRIVVDRAQDCCEYCGSQSHFSMQSFSVDHVVPKVKGGETEVDNLALTCQGCNNHKYNKTEARDPLSGEIVPLHHPRRQKWRDNFAWNYDCALMIGLTPTGRATIEALHLNRKSLINLRRLLYEKGKHPPQNFAKV